MFGDFIFSFSCILSVFLISLVILSLINQLFRSALFNFHMLMNFPNFLLWLIYRLISVILGKHILDDFSHLEFIVLFCSLVYSLVLENFLCVLEKNVYSAAVESCVLQMSMKSNWFLVFFQFSISLLTFCLVFLSII